jgi:hypothetical protein
VGALGTSASPSCHCMYLSPDGGRTQQPVVIAVHVGKPTQNAPYFQTAKST